jgi:hypothetical protein
VESRRRDRVRDEPDPAQIVLRTPDGQEFSGVGVALRTGPEQVASYLTEELVEAATAELDVEAGRTQHT